MLLVRKFSFYGNGRLGRNKVNRDMGAGVVATAEQLGRIRFISAISSHSAILFPPDQLRLGKRFNWLRTVNREAQSHNGSDLSNRFVENEIACSEPFT